MHQSFVMKNNSSFNMQLLFWRKQMKKLYKQTSQKKVRSWSNSLLAVSVAGLLTLTACGDSDSSDNTSNNAQAKYGVAFKASTTGETEYLMGVDSLTKGTIDADGKGVEQIKWNFFYNVGNTVFVSGYQNYEAKAYEYKNGKYVKKASFFYDKPIEVFANLDNKTLLASDTPRDGSHSVRKLYFVDANSGQITKKLDYKIFDKDTGKAGEGSVGYPLALVVNGNKMFVPFQKLSDDGSFLTPDANKAYVAVYQYPLVKNDKGIVVPEKIIEDARTSNIGVNGVSTGLIKTDSGDMYSFSNGTLSAGFKPASTKPSGILKIKAGTTEFDKSYFLDITKMTKGGSIYNFNYLGGNKALARIITDEKACTAAAKADKTGKTSCLWSAFYGAVNNQKLAIIDLKTKTMTDVGGVPLHSKRYSGPVNVINGKVYESIEVGEDVHMYEIDVATAIGTKGAKVNGKTIKGVFPIK